MSIKIRIKKLVKALLRTTVLPAYYNIGRLMAIDPELVVLADSNTDGVPESMRLVAGELKRRGYKVKVMCRDIYSCTTLGWLRFMTDFMLVYARARAVFICNYFVPVTACRKRKGTTVVQLWHGCGCLKKFGFDSEIDGGSLLDKDHSRNNDLICVSAPACIEPFTSAMGAKDGVVRALGVSRTDVYFRKGYREKCRQELFEKYPEFRGKRLVLYAPTFRGNPSEPYCVGEQEVVKLRERLGEQWAVIIKLHPLIKSDLNNCTIDTGRLTAAADMLITDYSSVVFDFALTGKPIVLFVPDFEEYADGRDFYIDHEGELPGERCRDGEELYGAVLRAWGTAPDDKYRKFLEKYMSACDGAATERIVDAALGMGR